MNAIVSFLGRVKRTGRRRPGTVATVAMGRRREFSAYDIGGDTFILERGIGRHLTEHPSVLVAIKRDLGRREEGRVFTITTGNHSVAAFPLLDGRFWQMSRLPSDRRSAALMHDVLCANVVAGRIEISPREVAPEKLFAADAWLRETCGFTLADIVMGERNDATLEHYRRIGQEWRVKPLAWGENEVRVALAASRKRISTRITYYHSMKGVHFLSCGEFRRFAALAESEPAEFVRGLRELTSVYEGNEQSFLRLPKHRGHHEVELFGIERGVALERLVPELERLADEIDHGRIGQLGVIQRIEELADVFEDLLSQPELADETSKVFAETLYIHITGEIYAVVGEGSVPAFDDRRTALPGATFTDGRMTLHPGVDERTGTMLSNLRLLMGQDEVVEYVNVYELRGDDESVPFGKGKTREVVYKTSLRPLEQSLVEKRMSRARRGYGGYMLARVEGFKALGVSLSDYRLLRLRARGGRRTFESFVRLRCEGEPMEAIPAAYFRSVDDVAAEEKAVVLQLATLMGDAAAQNMAMKKFDPASGGAMFGEGKEIYAFGHDIMRGRMVPQTVSTCSVRGSLGWPCLDLTDENLAALERFYMGHFAHALRIYQRRHRVTMTEVATRFFGGFEYRTRAMAWQLGVRRADFESFRPLISPRYGFERKWRFALWALERQALCLRDLKRIFYARVDIEGREDDEKGKT